LESDLQKHIEDIYSALGGKVSREEIEKELRTFVDEFKVSMGSAKRSIVRKHGGDPDALSIGAEKGIAELVPGMSSVDISGRVVQIARREIEVSGERRVILSGIVEDATGSVEFTIWEPGVAEIGVGDIVTIRNAYTTDYRGRTQLNVSSKSKWWVREQGSGWSREPRKISEINANEQNVCFEGKVISISSKRVERDGQSMEIHYGLIGDEEKTVRFTAWKDFGISKGDVIRVEGAYARERNGEIQLNIGERAQVQHIEREISSVARYGVPRVCTVSELRDGMGNVTVTGKLLSVSRKEIERNGMRQSMYSGIIADQTGSVTFTGWRDFEFSEGDVVRIEGAYVRSWKGVPQLKFDEKSKVVREKMSMDLQGPPAYRIEELEERGGAMEALVTGTVVEIRQGTGLVLRCPECGRSTRLGECRTHGAVEGVPDFRLRIVLDDGTGSMTVNFPREVAESITGLTLEEVKEMAEKAVNPEAAALPISQKLLLSIIKVQGKVYSDEFGLSMNASRFEFSSLDVRESASQLFAELSQQAGM